MYKIFLIRQLSLFLSFALILLGFHSSISQAAMISTHETLAIESTPINKQSLLSALDRDEVKAALLERGVSINDVAARINSLTDDEILILQQKIDELPAGASTLGLLVTVLIFFVITDMLCATSIFSFVKCINK